MERLCLPAEASIALLAVLLAIQKGHVPFPFGKQVLLYLCRSLIAAGSLLRSWAGESQECSFLFLAPEGLARVQLYP